MRIVFILWWDGVVSDLSTVYDIKTQFSSDVSNEHTESVKFFFTQINSLYIVYECVCMQIPHVTDNY